MTDKFNIEGKAISDIFTEKYYEVTYFNGITYVSYLFLELFHNIGISALLKKEYLSSEEIIRNLDFATQARFALEWMLSFLNQNNFIKGTEEDNVKRYYYDRNDIVDHKGIFKKISKLDHEIIPSCNLMENVISEYPNFLKGTKTGIDILFAKDKMTLWMDYFSNNNSGYVVYNAFGAFGVSKWLPTNKKSKFLEVGGGGGSAAVFLFQELIEKNLLQK
ncbi:MAG: hypothetical protein Q8N14_04590, partial [Candidatus Omnitrophota bacterium]|nr:hypothetical protein [Candidatus Omnitrophota bacterium]